MYLFYLVAPEGKAVGFVVGVGEEIDDAASNCELAWSGDEIYPFEAGIEEQLYDFVVSYLFAFANLVLGLFYGGLYRYGFFEGFRVAYHYAQPVFLMIQYLLNGGGSLYVQGGFVVASLYA